MSRLGSLKILDYLGDDIVNEALIKQVAKFRKTNKESNNEVISAKTGIDKSTVSLHLSSQRQVSLADCRKYAQFLNLPLIKVIDDKLVKYPVSAYVNNDGEVLMRQPHQNEIIIQPNAIESTGEYAIYNQDFQSLHWYHPQIHSHHRSPEAAMARRYSRPAHQVRLAKRDRRIVSNTNIRAGSFPRARARRP